MREKIEIFVSDKCPDCTLIMADRAKNPEKYEGISFTILQKIWQT